MTTLENNILIAKFIGRAGKHDENLFWVNIEGTAWVTVDSMKFHKSWDWLMPVLEKIMDICFQSNENTGENINDPEDFYAIRDCIPDITHTYKAVIEFIKNYNKK